MAFTWVVENLFQLQLHDFVSESEVLSLGPVLAADFDVLAPTPPKALSSSSRQLPFAIDEPEFIGDLFRVNGRAIYPARREKLHYNFIEELGDFFEIVVHFRFLMGLRATVPTGR